MSQRSTQTLATDGVANRRNLLRGIGLSIGTVGLTAVESSHPWGHRKSRRRRNDTSAATRRVPLHRMIECQNLRRRFYGRIYKMRLTQTGLLKAIRTASAIMAVAAMPGYAIAQTANAAPDTGWAGKAEAPRDAAYFSRCFSWHVGHSPRSFKETRG
jgi:hypothetical protein